METAFAIVGALTLVGALAAVTLPNLVHCALALVLAFGGLAALFLTLGAQFVGFAQLLVYVGAVAILIVFAILLTRGGGEPVRPVFSSARWGGIAVAVLVFGLLCYGFLFGPASLQTGARAAAPSATAGKLGEILMTEDVLPLEGVGLLLTAALIGAAVMALREEDEP